ncbi:MAG: nitroreductase [Bacteroidetes bacterium HGW-Bacteroidetes-1]|jgi:nitroreductase|nr:MAG: nitroreductase [Bacteroidetes bacterium HGW-Bacteroidetes-1]
MSTKLAKTNFEIHPLLKKRWSPRSFSKQEVEAEKLQSMFEAARWAPSSSNEQPWRFIVGIKGDATYQRIFSILVEFNQLWTITAPILILAIARKSSVKRPDKENISARYDVGQAMAYLTFQASSDGLYVHQMGGLDTQKAAEIFDVPKDYVVLTASAIGYIGDPEALHPNLIKMEKDARERNPLNEQVFESSFGNPSNFVK